MKGWEDAFKPGHPFTKLERKMGMASRKLKGGNLENGHGLLGGEGRWIPEF